MILGNFRALAGLVLACAASLHAVSVINVTTSTTVFKDNFENGTFTPSVGSWSVVGPDVTISSAPVPGPAEGTFYASLFRDSNTPSQGNLQASFTPQSTAGNIILLRMMIYLNVGDNNDARAQLILDDGDFTSARAWARPDGFGHVMAVETGGSPGTFVEVNTGLLYTPGVWQEWDLQYAVGASTFSLTVNGASASGFASVSTGAVSKADLFNGVANPGGTFFLDAVPTAVTGTPEPGSVLLAGFGLALVAGVTRRAARRRPTASGARS
jgi:hypothetical protein